MGARRGGIKGEFPWPGTFHDECPRCGAKLAKKDESDESYPLGFYECGHVFGWRMPPKPESQ